VALVIGHQLQRAADLAARYGGEEFAVLLPNTDKEGCRRVADNIRKALYDLGIEHATNEPFGRITISAGGTAAWPAESSADASALVEQADAALYLAKNSGRNDIRIAGQVIPLDASRRRA
jgi:diguanylate cyclase (GGDEF)-like protein